MKHSQSVISIVIATLGLIAILIVFQFESITPGNAFEEHESSESHEEEHGPNGGKLLGKNQPVQLEVKGLETIRGQLKFVFYAYQNKQPIKIQPSVIQVIWKRLEEEHQMTVISHKNQVLTKEFINEPHSFSLKMVLTVEDKNYAYKWDSPEYQIEMSDEQLKANQLKTDKVTTHTLVNEIDLPGKIAVDQDKLVHVVPKVSGTVLGVYKHLGEPVRKGELLAVLDSRELGNLKLDYFSAQTKHSQAQERYYLEQEFYQKTQQLVNALKHGETIESLHHNLIQETIGKDRQQLIDAYANYQLKSQNFARESTLLAQQATSEVEHQLAQKEFYSARSAYQGLIEEISRQRYLTLLKTKNAMTQWEPELTISQKKLQTLGLNPVNKNTRFELRSPIAGHLINKHIAKGEFLDGKTNAFVIADLSEVWAEMMASESQLEHIRLSNQVEVRSQNSSRESSGKISHVGSVIDEKTRTVEAHAEILNPDRFWKPGMFVTVSIQNKSRQVPIAVKKEAIQTLKGKPFVFVRYKNIIQGLPVVLGERDRHWVEIVEGLKAGQEYISSNSYLIKAELEKSSAEHSH